MAIRNHYEPTTFNQLSAAIAHSLKRPHKKAPIVFEENDCIVIEMPAPRGYVDELEIRLEGERTLVLSSQADPTFYARVMLPARVSPTDSVAYSLHGVLSLTLLKAEVAEELVFEDEPELALALAAS